jgi:hypothetical protein
VRIDAQSLIGPAIGLLYLKDCLLFLAPDEAVLVRGWRGRWRACFGRHDWRLRGREPWLCNPFKPHQPVLRLRWNAAAPAPTAPLARAEVAPELALLGPWVWAIWLTLFGLLPLAFYGHLGLRALLVGVVALYAFIVGALALVYRRRESLGLDRAALGVLAFELLACAPYAANLVRRLALARRVDEDLTTAADRLLDADALARMRAHCLTRMDDELDWLPEDSPRAQALQAARSRFAP